MRRVLFTAVLAALLLAACAAPQVSEEPPVPLEPPAVEVPEEPPAPPPPTEEELAAERVEDLLNSMTLEEKVGQLFFARCPATGALEDIASCHLGGYLLFGRDFKDAAGNYLKAEQVTEKIRSYQDAARIPLLIGVDEEGGSVARASWNPNLFPNGRCKSPQWLLRHQNGEGDLFAEDAREKSGALLRCGVNVNLAPVCDVSLHPGSFIYDRTLGQDAPATADYVERVVSAMRESGIGSVLKHFPGYGDNVDTHDGIALDQRPMETFLESDFLPFRAGLAAGGDTAAVLVCHNIVSCMDPELPASDVFDQPGRANALVSPKPARNPARTFRSPEPPACPDLPAPGCQHISTEPTIWLGRTLPGTSGPACVQPLGPRPVYPFVT